MIRRVLSALLLFPLLLSHVSLGAETSSGKFSVDRFEGKEGDLDLKFAYLGLESFSFTIFLTKFWGEIANPSNSTEYKEVYSKRTLDELKDDLSRLKGKISGCNVYNQFSSGFSSCLNYGIMWACNLLNGGNNDGFIDIKLGNAVINFDEDFGFLSFEINDYGVKKYQIDFTETLKNNFIETLDLVLTEIESLLA